MARRLLSMLAVLLLLLTAAPVMACVTDQPMTQSENDCCHNMQGNCGDMTKTGCCRVEVHDQQPQVAAHAAVVSFPWTAVGIISFDLVPPHLGLPARWLAPAVHSPPIPLPAKPTVLRI